MSLGVRKRMSEGKMGTSLESLASKMERLAMNRVEKRMKKKPLKLRHLAAHG